MLFFPLRPVGWFRYRPYATAGLVAAGVGVAAGLLLLRKGWVDCDGEDWFSLRAAEKERWATVRKIPDRPSPVPATPTDILNWILPVAGGALIAVDLLVVHTVDWGERATRDAAFWRTLGAFGLIAAGAFVFRHWRNR